jgi:hypothetical protein
MNFFLDAGAMNSVAATGAAALFRPPLASSSQQARVLRKPIPSTGEEVPAVGLGSWITFNVGNDSRVWRHRPARQLVRPRR